MKKRHISTPPNIHPISGDEPPTVERRFPLRGLQTFFHLILTKRLFLRVVLLLLLLLFCFVTYFAIRPQDLSHMQQFTLHATEPGARDALSFGIDLSFLGLNEQPTPQQVPDEAHLPSLQKKETPPSPPPEDITRITQEQFRSLFLQDLSIDATATFFNLIISSLKGENKQMVIVDEKGQLATQKLPNLSLNGRDLSITGGNMVVLPNDVQRLEFAGQQLTITKGNEVTLPLSSTNQTGLLSSEDWQTFSEKEEILTFSGGLIRVDNTATIIANSLDFAQLADTMTLDADTRVNLYEGTARDLMFYNSNSGAEMLYLNGSLGNVGIGTTAPVSLLDVAGTSWLKGSTASSGGLYVNGSGNVGIGTTVPGEKLDVNGNMAIRGNLYVNGLTLSSGGGVNNIFLGAAGNSTLTGTENIAIGLNALEANTSANYSIAIGSYALENNTSATFNLAVGRQALQANTTGTENACVGHVCLKRNTTGKQNAAFANDALAYNTTGNYNTALGWSALLNNTSGYENTAVGISALVTATTGNNNTCVGKNCLPAVTTGNNNVSFGAGAGKNIITGSNNVFIGTETSGLAAANNSIAIGYNSTVGCDNCMALGGIGVDAVKVGIGTSSPSYPLSVVGNAYVTGNFGIGNTLAGQKLTVGGGNINLDDTYGILWNNNPNVGLKYTSNVLNMQAFSHITFGGWNGSAYTERIRVQANTGYLGIGTTSPGYKLQVGDAGDGSQARANAWNTLSDARLKENINLFTDSLGIIDQLQGVRFTWKGTGEKSIGFIAQDLEHVLPEIVSTGEDGYKSVNYPVMNALFAEGIKALNRKVDTLSTTTALDVLTVDSQFASVKGRLSVIEERLGVKEQEEQIASVSATLAALKSDVELLKGTQYIASVSAALDRSDFPVVAGDTSLPSLIVTGHTNLYDLSVTGEISSGLLLIQGIDCGEETEISPIPEEHCEARLSTLSGPLQIQPEATGPLEIMAGKVRIDPTGNMTIDGKLTVTEIETESINLKNDVMFTSGETAPIGTCQTGAVYVWNDKLKDEAKMYICTKKAWHEITTQ